MIYDIIGWIGMVLVLLAYVLLSMGIIKRGLLYQLLNLFAGIFMAIGLYPKSVWFSFALQVIWASIALFSIFKLKSDKTKTAKLTKKSSKKRRSS